MSPRPPLQRRAVVVGLAGLLAGCSGRGVTGGDATPTGTDSPTATESSTSTDTPSPTAEPARIVVRSVSPTELSGRVVVLPHDLGRWLRQAASTGGTIRTSVEVDHQMPEPALGGLAGATLAGGGDDVDGSYALDVDGGPRYEYKVGAASVDSVPDDEDVTPVSELSDPRRELVRTAVDPDETATVYPETELGSWVRTEFFGGYYRVDGDDYRGHEIQQTDAAFFSTELWYVIALSAADGEGSWPTLWVGDVDGEAWTLFDDLLSDGDPPTETYLEGPFSDGVVQFAAEFDAVLTHTYAFEVEYRPDG